RPECSLPSHQPIPGWSTFTPIVSRSEVSGMTVLSSGWTFPFGVQAASATIARPAMRLPAARVAMKTEHRRCGCPVRAQRHQRGPVTRTVGGGGPRTVDKLLESSAMTTTAAAALHEPAQDVPTYLVRTLG